MKPSEWHKPPNFTAFGAGLRALHHTFSVSRKAGTADDPLTMLAAAGCSGTPKGNTPALALNSKDVWSSLLATPASPSSALNLKGSDPFHPESQ